MISKKLTDKLELKTKTKRTKLFTVEGVTNENREHTKFNINNIEETVNIEIDDALVLDFLTTNKEKPPRNEEIEGIEYLEDVYFIELPHNNIEVILPSSTCHIWHDRPTRRSTPEYPIAINTLFGWGLMGGNGSRQEDEEDSNFRIIIENDNKTLHNIIDKVYSQDFPTISKNKTLPSEQDKHAVRQLEESIRFDPELGHYIAPLPYVTTREETMKRLNEIDSSPHALNRLKKSIDKIRDNDEKLGYVRNQMNAMFEEDHAAFIQESDIPEGVPRWVLPLHIVFHPAKPTKPRCCHDGRSKLQGVCLNDNLLTGPDLLNSLLGVIFRFRRHKITVSADIKGFFHQVYVDERDAFVFQFWWYEDKECTKPRLSYLKVHIFGAKSSPTVCTFVLRHHGKIYKEEISPEVAEAIIKCFYVDDYLDSFKTVEKAREVRIELTEVLRKGGFELCKWNSSDKRVLEDEETETEDTKEIEELEEVETTEKVLGVKYSFKKDEFFFAVKPDKINTEVKTRRQMLKVLASCFDPLGIAAPYLLRGKLIFQKATKLTEKGWDDRLTDELNKPFNKWMAQLTELTKWKITRWLKSEITLNCKPQLHGFVDASKLGYGYVFYRRAAVGKHVDLRFLFAKSRVVPANHDKARIHDSIPRLELTAAKAASDFYEDFVNEAGEEYEEENIFFWSDSSCVLKWITDRKMRPDVFLDNRLSIIRAKTRVDRWFYVPTKKNPADYASRGLDASDNKFDLFHNGPLFLRDPEWNGPDEEDQAKIATIIEEAESEEEQEEEHKEEPKEQEKDLTIEIIEKFSVWSDKIRILARVIKCTKKWKTLKRGRRNGRLPTLTSEELKEAEEKIYKAIQTKQFTPERKILEKSNIRSPQIRRVPNLKNSKLRKLNIFLDQNNIIRSGTRMINNEQLSHDNRYPIVMHNKDPNVEALARYIHLKYRHIGIEQLRNTLRQKYAIVDDGHLSRKITSHCVTCQKIYKQPQNQMMGPLPTDRTTVGAPFEVSGADLAGPFEMRETNKKTKKKCWIVLFTCLKVRAVHLEVVESISAPALINAIIRFQARRPGVRKIYSDQGTNFIGAENLIKQALELQKQENTKTINPLRPIEWVQNAPHAPHRGGCWERIVQITKRHLNAILGKTEVDLETFRTITTHIELIINNRPITQQSSEQSDIEPLTPANLLWPGIDIHNDPQLERFERPDNKELRHAHQRTIKLVRTFWNRWATDYVTTLKHRSKWTKDKEDIKVDQIVIISDDQKPRHRWRMGRVVRAEKSESDGRVRTVEVQVENRRTLIRPTNKVITLEMDRGEI